MKKYCLLVVCAVLFSACVKSVDHYYLSDTIKLCVSYQLGDTERFADGTGETMTLKVESIKDDWRCLSDGSLLGSTTAYFQCRNMQLLSEDGSDGINVTIHEWLYWGFDQRSPRIDFQLLPSGKMVTVGFDLSGNFTQTVWSDRMEVYDSTQIGGQMYYDVAEAMKCTDRYQTDTLKFYYNKPYGVLQVKENDKVVLERRP